MGRVPSEAWRDLWDERGRAVRRVLGETMPPGRVTPFEWRDHILPGACGLVFGPGPARPHHTYMTLGLTQPLQRGDVVPAWEFAVKAGEPALWQQQVLYDLLTCWLTQRPIMRRGLRLPLTFFLNADGDLCAGLASLPEHLRPVGVMRGLYLWDDDERLRFKVSSGAFGLMVAVGVTEDEIRLAESTTPPHLLLLLKRMRVGQVLDPLRPSVMTRPGAMEEWNRIRPLAHEAVLEALACD